MKKTIIGTLTGLMLLGAVGISQAADTTTATVQDPGPTGDFNWKGFNWEKRTWAGAPMYNGQWSANNVSNPDANGFVKLSLSNPTGTAPIAAEMQSTRQGFGYGTYSTVVEKDINSMQKEAVWGCMFTYDSNAAPGYTEIDLCEASAWGGGAAYGQNWPITQGHGYWFDAAAGPGAGNTVVTFPVTSSPILTHRMVWEPGRITYETFEGEGFTGNLIKRTVLEGDKVPVPAKERIHFNLWVTGGGGGSPSTVKPESVTVRDFTFTPASSTATATPTATDTATGTPTATDTATASPSPTATATSSPSLTATATATASPSPTATATTSPINLTYTTANYKSGYRTTLKWSGTSEKTVYMYVNGVKKSISNTGSFINDVKKGSTTTYQLCDSTSCSNTQTVKVP